MVVANFAPYVYSLNSNDGRKVLRYKWEVDDEYGTTACHARM